MMRRVEDLRIATYQLLLRQWKSWEDSRASKGGGGLATAFIAVADIECEGFGEGRFEGYGSTFCCEYMC